MVKHQPLQVYEPQLCLSCLTGIYGCRWKRYQRSHDDTTKWELVWFLILCSTFSLLFLWLYFWVEVQNDYDDFNWFLYNRTGSWSDWSIPVLIATAASFTYIAFLLVLALCHIAVGQQLNLHWLHKIGVTATLITTLIALVSVEQLWKEEWDILLISFQATGPFLHMGAVAAATILAWLVAGQFARAEKTMFQAILLITYLGILVSLYLVPLTITSPCLMEKKNLGPRPTIFGHRGAPMLAPENTLMSFQKAVELKVSGLQSDVQISHDGIPFLMHDRTLRRTTNVGKVFPHRTGEASSMFNWTDLQSLNAGEWFIKDDPFWTVSSLSEMDYTQVGNQSICSLSEMLQLAIDHNKSVIFSLWRPPPEHPFFENWINVTLETILQSGIRQELIMWTSEMDRAMVQQIAPGFRQISEVKENIRELLRKGIFTLNLRYNQIKAEEIREFSTLNFSINLFTVNEPWLYSVLWCSGVQSVTSNAPQILDKVPYPIWLMPPDEYYWIWIILDLISFIIVIGIFVLQNYHIIRYRLGNIRSYNPEQIMLSAAVHRSSRDVNVMKEKLIFSEINNGVGSAEEVSLCSENGYDGYSNEVVTPIDSHSRKIRVN
ncbi:glycerophosphodiester phosphodiesterase domain-containing protein 5-like isoform X1 [Polypterus senegalus]|uniref:glycerophosphodiester phosphodiesterase domain-containing protein 5-like isoform X1 n=1 Tax=Polypterus senegalus TaxID=55291 RepID=UPI001963C4EC|nr:glycerophosphodiester phosphodiesterase domain-containing protein 5-like isoform X1 [Polypterus senegalus]